MGCEEVRESGSCTAGICPSKCGVRGNRSSGV